MHLIIQNLNVKIYVVLKFSARRTVRTHRWFKSYAAKHRLSTQQTSVNQYEFQLSTVLYSLMMDHIRSETCRSDF